MKDAGLEARQIDNGGYPLVYGEWTGVPGKPTILFYGHYDVQPADPLELWDNPPFEPTVIGDEIIARGATDDKGQSFAHLKAVAAILAERGSLPINVKFIIEGEEESGGEAIDRFVRDRLGRRQGVDATGAGPGAEKIERLFTEYVREVAPPGVEVEVTAHHGAAPVLLETEGPVVQGTLGALYPQREHLAEANLILDQR